MKKIVLALYLVLFSTVFYAQDIKNLPDKFKNKSTNYTIRCVYEDYDTYSWQSIN